MILTIEVVCDTEQEAEDIPSDFIGRFDGTEGVVRTWSTTRGMDVNLMMEVVPDDAERLKAEFEDWIASEWEVEFYTHFP